jgi:hypothetical protein
LVAQEAFRFSVSRSEDSKVPLGRGQRVGEPLYVALADSKGGILDFGEILKKIRGES